jgi:uncharacterized membrane protein
MRTPTKAACLLLSVWIVAATAAFAQTGKCSFQALNLPAPASGNVPVALNDAGAVAGGFFDAQKVGHGWFLYQGRISTFKFPGSTTTSVVDMSRNGIIVGGYGAKDGKEHLYMVHSGGFHEIIFPGATNPDVLLSGVNSNGDIVGQLEDNVVGPAGSGYLLHNGEVTLISAPGGDAGTLPTSINDAGVVVGNTFSRIVNANPAFMWKNGVFSEIRPPDATSSPFVFPTKISNSGVVVGWYGATSDTHDHGFAFKNGKYTRIDVPGFSDTVVLAVNKFDNILVQAQLSTQQGIKTALFKGFCAAAF